MAVKNGRAPIGLFAPAAPEAPGPTVSARLRGIKRMEFPLSVRKKAFVWCCRDGVPHCEGCGIEINARTGIIYEHVIPAGLGGEPTQVWQKIDAIRAKQASKPKHSPLPQTETTFSAVASAMMKFAPDLAEELVKRFREAQREQEAGLQEFLKVLRASPGRD